MSIDLHRSRALPSFGGMGTLGRKYALSFSGEALQSGFHFLLNIALIRVMPAYDYGIFAIIFILGGISLTYGNAFISVPATIHISRKKTAHAANLLEVVFGSVALAVVAGLAAVVAAGLWLTISQPATAAAAGAFIALWTLRNHLRAALFARGRVVLVTISDLCYSFSSFALVGALFLPRFGAPQVSTIIALLAFTNMLAIAIALKGRNARIRVSLRRYVRDRYRAVWPDVHWSVLGVTAWNIQGQAPMFLIAAIAGPAAYAPVAAGVVLFNPLRTALGAFINIVRPEFAADLAHARYQQAKATLFFSTAVIILCCLAFGAAIYCSWGYLDAVIYKGKFSGLSMSLIVTLAGLVAVIFLSYHVPLSLVHASGGFRTVAIATSLGGAVGLISTLSVLALGGGGLVASRARSRRDCLLVISLDSRAAYLEQRRTGPLSGSAHGDRRD